MSSESGSKFGSDGFASGSGLPNPEDIQMEDCTLALIAANKALSDAKEDLKDRIIEKEQGRIIYDCNACFARLEDAGFSNIIGSMSCRSQYRDGANATIENPHS